MKDRDFSELHCLRGLQNLISITTLNRISFNFIKTRLKGNNVNIECIPFLIVLQFHSI